MPSKIPKSDPSVFFPLVILIVICLSLLIVMIFQPTPDAPGQTVAMNVPCAPIPVASELGTNLAYELELIPSPGQTIVPEKIDVIDPATGAVLYSAGGELFSKIYHPASVPPPTSEELQNGTGKLINPRISIWFKVEPDMVPNRLIHRITMNQTASRGVPVILTGGEVDVQKALEPVVIGSPMHGSGWMALETTSPLTHHFLGQITMGGVPRVPQRYAQDWILVDPETGRAGSGNTSLAKNYYGYGKEIYAVADGTVISAVDGFLEWELIYSAVKGIDGAAGNFVILDIGNGKYACYGHMIPGSLTVKAGDVVKEGQVIGLMGNSGNSDLPHLHFQVVTDDPTFFESEGYPHVYRTFESIGSANETIFHDSPLATMSNDQFYDNFYLAVTFEKEPIPRENMLMENWIIVSFPESDPLV